MVKRNNFDSYLLKVISIIIMYTVAFLNPKYLETSAKRPLEIDANHQRGGVMTKVDKHLGEDCAKLNVDK